ncbi:glycosyl hydrolase [Streptomyces sp. NBC_00385]|uniref:glycosyl hydrolase n=1 Tax=Streptomyces sp. NBC_00385 TaxID=2975733 RepID=UPI002DDAA3EC|nr:glycosyl hydrolase [Streptomyces sp. NBC_00385]WRZ03623.1 glycosyl hydrolase [Streptomyces sp. NBC_00385]
MNDEFDSDLFDLGLADLTPVDANSGDAKAHFWPGDLVVLAEHGTLDAETYVVAIDSSATWGVPGEPQICAIKIARDFNQGTYTYESGWHATASFAQNWLIERGCPPEPISQIGEDFMQPADDLMTQVVEQKIRASGARYEVLDTYTSDSDPCETWTLTRDGIAPKAPIRVFLDEGDLAAHTYTLREGAFADEHAARMWLDERSGPLPAPPDYRGEVALRTAAALTRSAGAYALPRTGIDPHGTSPATTGWRPNSGRSI